MNGELSFKHVGGDLDNSKSILANWIVGYRSTKPHP